jgi:hypothetical protein
MVALSLLFVTWTNGQELLQDPGFESSDVDNQINPFWTLDVNFPDDVGPSARFQAAPWASNPGGTPGIGVWLRSFEGAQGPDEPLAEARVYQDVDASPGVEYVATTWYKAEANFLSLATVFGLDFLQGDTRIANAPIVELTSVPRDATWREYTTSGISPTDTDTVRIYGQMIDGEFVPSNPQSAMFDDFSLTAHVVGSLCDFDSSGACDVDDLDELLDAIGGNNPVYNLDPTDAVINSGDRDAWLSIAGTENLGTSYVLGDTDLDGDVDSGDLNNLGSSWRSTDNPGWMNGDFNGDDVVNPSDLNDLGLNWQYGVPNAAKSVVVPEPSGLGALASALTLGLLTYYSLAGRSPIGR